MSTSDASRMIFSGPVVTLCLNERTQAPISYCGQLGYACHRLTATAMDGYVWQPVLNEYVMLCDISLTPYCRASNHPFTLCGTVKWVSAFGLSNNNKCRRNRQIWASCEFVLIYKPPLLYLRDLVNLIFGVRNWRDVTRITVLVLIFSIPCFFVFFWVRNKHGTERLTDRSNA